jgi:diguanylate cyclase (GGDEF)-like protein
LHGPADFRRAAPSRTDPRTRWRIFAEQNIRELAFQDPLTGLANRRQFDDALKAATGAPPHSGACHALLLLDLNGFKQVNDVHGHGVGDELLIVVARRLAAAMGKDALVARIGGDEFAILAQHLMGAEAATNLAVRALQAIDETIFVGKVCHQVGSGIGIALIPGDAATPREALRKADVALYRAKSERRSAQRFFKKDMDGRVFERDQLSRHLRSAIANDLIRPVFQPIVDLKTGTVRGFEATPRWIDAGMGEIAPERFIPLAEENGLIHKLFERILHYSCIAAETWPADVTLSLDIFPAQLKDPALGTRILSALQASRIAPARLELEITERALVHELESVQEILGPLRNAGVQIVLDNFGTGYSSLYHLRNFKLDKIKIDRSFIDTLESQESSEIVNALVGLGRGLGFRIVADGVDAREQRTSLLNTGCEQGQGGFFGAAVSADETSSLFTIKYAHA